MYVDDITDEEIKEIDANGRFKVHDFREFSLEDLANKVFKYLNLDVRDDGEVSVQYSSCCYRLEEDGVGAARIQYTALVTIKYPKRDKPLKD